MGTTKLRRAKVSKPRNYGDYDEKYSVKSAINPMLMTVSS